MTGIRRDLESVRQATQRVYECKALGYDARRARIFFEKGWLDRFLEQVPPGGHLLDLGCGAGEPIAAYILEQGFELTGIDYSPAMITMARARFPQASWHVQDMRALTLDSVFDGAISWDGSFHLSPEEQRALIGDLGPRLKSGAPLMLTIGPGEGETVGTVEGEPVYHASLSETGYRTALEQAGFDMTSHVTDDVECDLHSVLFATKRPDRS